MKALLIVFVLVGLTVWALLHFGGTTTWDPADQVADFNKVAVAGATWEQVADFKAPKSYRKLYIDDEDGIGVAPSVKFKREKFETKFADGSGFPEGFIFEYAFTAEDVYDLHFDADGKLTSKEEPITTGDLLKGKATQKLMQ